LKDLEWIRVQDKNPNYNLVLLFKREAEMVLKVPSELERERLLSSIMTLRSLALPFNGSPDVLRILMNTQIDFAQRIFGLDTLEQPQLSAEYEGLLFRKMAENIKYKDNMKINALVEEILLNSSFAQLSKVDIRSLKLVINEIQSIAELYFQYESQEPQLIANMLVPSDARQREFPLLSGRMIEEEVKNAPIGGTTQSYIIPDDQQDKAKQVEVLIDKLTKYLNVLHLFLNSKAFLTEMAEHEEMLHLLKNLLFARYSYVSLLASHVLKATIHFYNGSESKIEGVIKRILVRGKPVHGAPSDQLSQIREHSYFFEQAFHFISDLDFYHEKNGTLHPLHIFSFGNVLRSIVRRGSTGKEELAIFAT